jgi:hypothetical protein
MKTLQKAMYGVFADLPHLVLSQLVDEKLRAQKIKLPKRRLKQLTTRILTEKTDSFTLDLGIGPRLKDLVLEFTDDDAENITRRVDKFLETLPQLVDDLAEDMSAKVLADLKKRWPSEARQQTKDISGFQKRLHQRWGAGIDGLRMLVTLAREFGGTFHVDMPVADHAAAPLTIDLLIRLHVRACQITDEIVCLMSNGFADGAMARWRTRHEIAAVCFLLREFGDDLTERYVAHQIVETRKAALQYKKHQQQLGQVALTDAELADIEMQYHRVLDKYGRVFKNSYGWAAKHLNKADPSIADLMEGSKIDHLAPYYRMASHNVHANPKGVFFKLGPVGEKDILLAGPSNAGLADPGHGAALSLLQISVALLQFNATLDNTVAIKIMSILADEIGNALLAAHKQLLVTRVLARRTPSGKLSVRNRRPPLRAYN